MSQAVMCFGGKTLVLTMDSAMKRKICRRVIEITTIGISKLNHIPNIHVRQQTGTWGDVINKSLTEL